MGVLKRFSYDNIVEHNPTAPDTVDYDGGGEGGGGSGGTHFYNVNWAGSGSDPSYSFTFFDISADISNNIMPVIFFTKTDKQPAQTYVASLREIRKPTLFNNVYVFTCTYHHSGSDGISDSIDTIEILLDFDSNMTINEYTQKPVG